MHTFKRFSNYDHAQNFSEIGIQCHCLTLQNKVCLRLRSISGKPICPMPQISHNCKINDATLKSIRTFNVYFMVGCLLLYSPWQSQRA